MVRSALGLGVVVLLLVVAGCTMCCHPYDYCGPVHDCTNECPPDGPSTSRYGSILSGNGQTVEELTPTPEASQQPTKARPTPAPTSTSRRAKGQTVSYAKSGSRSQASNSPRQQSSGRRQAQAQVKPGLVPGSEKIISVTDRAANEPASAAKVVSNAASDEETSTATTASPTSAGWTARRPTAEVMR